MDEKNLTTYVSLIAALMSACTTLTALFLGTIGWPWFRDRLAKKREGKYLAVRVVCLLDVFVEECASTAINRGVDEYGNGSHVDSPEPPAYPGDVNWKSIDDKMMYDLLSLPARTRRASNFVDACARDADDEDVYYHLRAETYSTLGLQAYEVCRDVRKKYSLPPAEFREWDPIARMEDELKQVAERRRKLEEYARAAPPPPL
jgi:hypothetical protein